MNSLQVQRQEQNELITGAERNKKYNNTNNAKRLFRYQ